MIRYINLPTIPQSIVGQLPVSIDAYEKKVEYDAYVWTDSFNKEINAWCKQNICEEMYWGFQIIRGDLPQHKDVGTKIKFVYVLETGGDNVVTNFYKEDQQTITHSYIIQPNKWHILEADCYHDVQGVAHGRYRMSVTGRIFPE